MMLGARGNNDRKNCIEVLHRAPAAAINFIDIVDMGATRRSEEIVEAPWSSDRRGWGSFVRLLPLFGMRHLVIETEQFPMARRSGPGAIVCRPFEVLVFIGRIEHGPSLGGGKLSMALLRLYRRQ